VKTTRQRKQSEPHLTTNHQSTSATQREALQAKYQPRRVTTPCERALINPDVPDTQPGHNQRQNQLLGKYRLGNIDRRHTSRMQENGLSQTNYNGCSNLLPTSRTRRHTLQTLTAAGHNVDTATRPAAQSCTQPSGDQLTAPEQGANKLPAREMRS